MYLRVSQGGMYLRVYQEGWVYLRVYQEGWVYLRVYQGGYARRCVPGRLCP